MKTYDLMKKNHTYINTEYKIDESKRTIICIISTINDYNRKLRKYSLFDSSQFDCCEDFRQYIGIARCAPEDKWDEAYGKRLAEYRASCLRRACLNHKINNFIKETKRRLDALNDFGKLKPPHRPE